MPVPASRRIQILIIAALASLAVACDSNRPSVSNTETRKITIAQFGDFFLYAPLYIAIDAGYFRQQGLEVTLLSTGGDDKTWAAVLSGDAEFGVADPTFVAIAGTKGQPGRVVANIVNGVPFWGVAYRDDIPLITSPKLLKPYTVATFPSPSTAFTLQTKMFQDAGLEPKIRQGAFGTLLSLVQTKQADIALELEPNVSQAARGGAHVVYSMKDIYGPFAITGLTATPETATSDGKLIEQVTCGLQLALDHLRDNTANSLDLLSRRFPDLSPEASEAALTRVLREGIIPETLTTGKDAWASAINLRVSTGDLPKQDDAYASYLLNVFAAKAATSEVCRARR